MSLQGHSPGDSWGLPGALELGGAGISDSGEASSSCSEQEEMVRTFILTKFLGQGGGVGGWGRGRLADPRKESQVQMTS